MVFHKMSYHSPKPNSEVKRTLVWLVVVFSYVLNLILRILHIVKLVFSMVSAT